MTGDAYRAMARKRRRIHLSADKVARMLSLPDDSVILHVVASTDPSGIAVIVAHPDFTEVDDYAQAPYLETHVQVEGGERTSVTYVDSETGTKFPGRSIPAWRR